MKKVKRFLFPVSVSFIVGIILTASFFYWQHLNNQQSDIYETIAEFDQLKIAKEQAKQLVTAAFLSSSTLDVNDLKNLSPKIYHVNFGILMYHHINYKAKILSVRPEILDAQIKYLLEQGYKFVKLSDAFKTFSLTSSTPYDKTLVLTFDDGYRDFYLNAYPILKKYNVPAGLYVINQDIGRPGNVSWEMLQILHQEGLIEIGVHTVNHLPLGRLKPEVAYYQMAKSKELLERGLHDRIDTIVYPFGNFNENVKKQAKQIGFIGAASVYFGDRPNGQDLYAWRRVMITNSDVGVLLLRKLFVAFKLAK